MKTLFGMLLVLALAACPDFTRLAPGGEGEGEGEEGEGEGDSIVCNNDGVVDIGEDCDDGDQDDDDGCSTRCTTVCGDGITSGAEECDDSNQTGDDGCSAQCKIECNPNGAVEDYEQCDDGESYRGACIGCRLQPGFDCDTDSNNRGRCWRLFTNDVPFTSRGINTPTTPVRESDVLHDLKITASCDIGVCASDLRENVIQAADVAVDLYLVRDFHVSNGATFTLNAASAVWIVAMGDCTIDGTIDAGARNQIGGPGAQTLAPYIGVDASENGDGGGGGGGVGGAGGNGGNGASVAPITRATGGAASDGNSPLVGGANGGKGFANNTDLSARGGAGGGAVQLSCAGTLTINGLILADGAPGQGGTGNIGGGGGGGGGGMIHLEARAIDVGSGAFNVGGGGGGAGATTANGGVGRSGRDGGIGGDSGIDENRGDGGTAPNAGADGTNEVGAGGGGGGDGLVVCMDSNGSCTMLAP
jgi:cysteine-rich repeat protein